MSDIGTAPAHLSHSQVDTLSGCGQKYYLERILRAPQTPAWFFIGGHVVHEVTEILDRSVLEYGELWDEANIQQVCSETFLTEINAATKEEPDTSKWRAGGKANAKEGEDWWRTNAPKMVQRWQDWHYASTNTLELWQLPNGQPAVEVELPNVTFGDVPVKLAIDRIMQDTNTGELLVVDIKAGSREPVGSNQLALYGEAVRRTFGIPIKYGAYWMARKGELTMPKDLSGVIPTLDDRFAKARQMIDQGLFLANPGMFCGSCSVKSYCSAMGGSPEPLLLGRVS